MGGHFDTDERFRGKRGKYVTRQVPALPASFANGNIVPGNGSRVSLIVFAVWEVPALGQYFGLSQVGGTAAAPFVAATNEQPCAVATLVTHGDAILGETYCASNVAPEGVMVYEVYWEPEGGV